MAEKLDIRLTLNGDSRVMLVATADNTLDTFDGLPITFTSSVVDTVVNNEVRFKCTIRDGYVLDTVTNTNEHLVVKCITDDSFVYTWADTSYHVDIIDTVTISTRAINDEPSVIGPNTNLNITTLANTKWEFTLYPTCNIELLWDCLSSYPEYGYSIYAINTKWNNDTNGGLYFYTGRPEPYDEVLIYRLTNDTWYGPRTIEVIDGDHITEPAVIEFFKSQATLLSGGPLDGGSGDDGDSGDSGETGGDSGSSGGSINIGPNAQLTEFLTEIADAIREKTGTSDPINPQDFATTIAEMQTGGGGGDLLTQAIEGTIIGFNSPELSAIGSYAFFQNPNLMAVNLPKCTSIGSLAFNGCLNIIDISLPKCTQVGSSAFYSCNGLTELNLPECTSIGSGAFQYCRNIAEINLPKCTYIDMSGFASCSALTNVNLPECLSLNTGAFSSCSRLTFISLPKCLSIGDNAFFQCYALSSVYMPNVSSLRSIFPYCSGFKEFTGPNVLSVYGTFMACQNLSSVVLPKCTHIGTQTFQNCQSLTYVSLPECVYVGDYAFAYCYKLPEIRLPKCGSIGYSAFSYCSELKAVYLDVCSRIERYAFTYCSKLESVYLLSTSVCSLVQYTAFNYTPISNSTYLGYFGSIYVPASLLTAYQTSTTWSMFSSRFVGV